ncbi:MAG: dTDP-4-dehydrorhamnose 3,5-epimerase family protein [Nanoarchaeota archaeon]|nr:dTDP-4-dehydrorhamnose 3,5-epimerase family protein [Nanoarchaeota archaeon]MBU1704468.1 dTDP-4-dehydrorhamnose 3,5-epimerase family protein [Nanoarchaeota archaeon]
MIKGIIIKDLNKNEDQRGWLSEVYRKDENNFKPVMTYVSFTNFGQKRGPHEHRLQSDFFVFLGPGDFELYLWDNRKDSPTFGENMKVVVGENNKVSVVVPPGVVHGYKAISKSGSLSINLPDKLYKGENKKDEVDEIRYEEDNDSRFKIV